MRPTGIVSSGALTSPTCATASGVAATIPTSHALVWEHIQH